MHLAMLFKNPNIEFQNKSEILISKLETFLF